MTAPRKNDRIRFTGMADDPDPIQVGQLGTVVSVSLHGRGRDAWNEIDVLWDNGRTLMLVLPPDNIEIVRGKD